MTPNFASHSRVLALGLLASGQKVRAGDRVLTEPWQINTVAPELVLRSAATGRPLCGPGSQPDPEPAPISPAFMPDASLSADARAAQVLLHILPESGEPVPATTVQAAVKQYGIGRRALAKAQSVLRIKPKKTTTGWTWALPKDEAA